MLEAGGKVAYFNLDEVWMSLGARSSTLKALKSNNPQNTEALSAL